MPMAPASGSESGDSSDVASGGPRGPGSARLAVAGFRPLTYASPGDLGPLTCPPYDVIDDAARASLTAEDEHNAVRLILPRDADEPGDRYREAARTLAGWIRTGVLSESDRPTLYVYEIADPDGVTRGVLGAIGLTAAEDRVILPHEDTMAGPVADRLALTEATAATLEAIMLVYDGSGGATRDITSQVAGSGEPAIVATVGAARHRLWAVTDEETIAAVASDLASRRAVIADGHHRYATALAYQRQRRAAGGASGPWDSTLAWLVDAGSWGPRVEAIHRVLPTLSYDVAVDAAQTCLDVSRAEDAEAALAWLAAQSATAFAVTDGHRWATVTGFDAPAVAPHLDAALPPDRSAAWRALDVSVAHWFLFATVWGVPDAEATVWYRHDVPDAVAAARDSGGTAVLLRPTGIDQVVAVAAAGDRMPRKSTLFVPKPRTGLVFRLMS